MEGIGSIQDDVRRHFRTKLKNIFTKLIRKFGYDMSSRLTVKWCHTILVASYDVVRCIILAAALSGLSW